MKKTLMVRNRHGIHVRVAARIAEECQKYGSKVMFCKGCSKADGCSIIGMLLLCAGEGSKIELEVDGGSEDIAIAAIADIFENEVSI
jgi:phosphocarrier protein HPr